MTSRFRTIDDVMEVTTKPIIFDGDTGGLTEHFVYTVRSLERMGISAIIIEDKVGLKKNSLFGTEVQQTQDSIEHFCEKIAAGKNIQLTDDFMIIARIESLILEQGMDDALERAFAYVKAGADGIMIHSRKKSPAEILEFCDLFREKDKTTPIVVVPSSFNSITESELAEAMLKFNKVLKAGKNVAFVVRKGALSYDEKVEYKNNYPMVREEIIQHIVKFTGEDPIISTTGKASRELFETREANGHSHKYDFLTVGSMGHASSIALGVAINKPNTKIWCVDGDGAVLMHMGSMAVLGANKPQNMVHIIINNEAHETVGGMPTVSSAVDYVAVAKACGYPNAICVDTFEALDKELQNSKDRNELSMIEVKCSIGARDER